jgi:hypothetical protein
MPGLASSPNMTVNDSVARERRARRCARTPALAIGKGKRNRDARKRRTTSLDDHVRDKKILTPPLAALPNLKPISWPHDAMPDFLWIQAIRRETRDLALANNALDVLDDFVPEDAGFLDGRISQPRDRPARPARTRTRGASPAGAMGGSAPVHAGDAPLSRVPWPMAL